MDFIYLFTVIQSHFMALFNESTVKKTAKRKKKTLLQYIQIFHKSFIIIIFINIINKCFSFAHSEYIHSHSRNMHYHNQWYREWKVSYFSYFYIYLIKNIYMDVYGIYNNIQHICAGLSTLFTKLTTNYVDIYCTRGYILLLFFTQDWF